MKTIVKSNLNYYYGGSALSFFKLSSMFLKDEYALTAAGPNHGVRMTKVGKELDDSMIWAFVDYGTGWSKIRNLHMGPNYALESSTVGAGASMRADGYFSGQYWKAVPHQDEGHFLLQSQFQGDKNALESNQPDTGQNSKDFGYPGPFMTPVKGGPFSGQLWKMTPVGAHDDLYNRIFTGNACGAVGADASSASLTGACAAVAKAAGFCAAVAAGAGACGAVAKITGACGAVGVAIGGCGAVAGGAGTCGAVAGGIGACGVVAGGGTACGIVGSGAGACGAVATGVGLCGAVVKLTGACGAVEKGVSFCPAAAKGEGACGADVGGAEAVGACAAQIGFCGLVACVAIPVGGNW